jgi:hypothetical protein
MLITSFLFGVGATVGRFVGECVIALVSVVAVLCILKLIFRRR